MRLKNNIVNLDRNQYLRLNQKYNLCNHNILKNLH